MVAVLTENGTEVTRYKLDSARSIFTVQAFADGFLAGFGHNPVIGIGDFTGEAKFAPGTLAESSLHLEIIAKSFSVLDEVKEKDKQEIERTMHEEVLETALYPEIVFQSTSVTTTRIIEGRYKARIIGDVTLHGVTRTGIWLLAQIRLGENELRATGDFVLKPTDYNIKIYKIAAGALKMKDELKFNFDLVGEQG